MSRSVKVFIALIGVSVLVGVGLLAYTSWNNQRIEKEISDFRRRVESGEVENQPLPDEIGEHFDPTQTAPTFRVESVDTATNTLNLLYMWPDDTEIEHVSATVACKPWDIRIVDKTDESTSLASPSQVMEQARVLIETKTVLFTGICGEASCATIVKDCKLLIYEK